jgi:SAM-dependent methyltransferase
MTCAEQLAPSLVADVIGWDIQNWSRALSFWNTRLPALGHYALELGCGHNSSLSLWLALRGFRVVCSDSGGVSEEIRLAHARHGVANSIDYADIDSRAIPYRSVFDAVMFKSMLGGIAGASDLEVVRGAVRQMHAALKPGGALLFAENLYATPIHQFARSRFGAGKLNWRYFTLAEVEGLLSDFAKVEIVTFGFLGCFGRSEPQRHMLGRLDTAIVDRLVPRSRRYIAGVCATK